jgi:predicted dehydrogenase
VHKIAIVGAGIMGANHGRVLNMCADADVTVVVDPDPARGEPLAASLGARFAQDIADLESHANAAVIATPTTTHEQIGIALLDAGLDVLVEKPMADSVAACKQLLDAAERTGRILMIGHVERFNPVVLELDRLLSDVLHIECARLGPYPSRIADSVVLDLMIHDIDIVRSLTKGPVRHVSAVGRRIRSERCELACALLEFETGVTASITASQLGQNKIRRLDITQPDSFVTVDLIRQDIAINRMTQLEFVSEEGVRYRQSGVMEVPFLEHRGEPLYLELRHFLDVIDARTDPRVSGRDGLEAVALALQIQELIERD